MAAFSCRGLRDRRDLLRELTWEQRWQGSACRLLFGTSDAGSSIAAASVAIIGTALIAASLALYWHNRPTRAPTR